MFHADLTSLAVQQPHYQFLARAAGAVNLLSFLISVHIAGESADEGFVSFDRTAVTELLETAALHSEADPMEHEPCGLLTDIQIAGDFARAYSVLAITDQPDGGQPLSQRQRRVHEDRADLHAELSAIMFLAAFPAPLISEKVNLVATAGRALSDAVWPAAGNHVSNTAIFIGEVADRVRQASRRGIIPVHPSNLAQGRGLVKSIFAQRRVCLAA